MVFPTEETCHNIFKYSWNNRKIKHANERSTCISFCIFYNRKSVTIENRTLLSISYCQCVISVVYLKRKLNFSYVRIRHILFSFLTQSITRQISLKVPPYTSFSLEQHAIDIKTLSWTMWFSWDMATQHWQCDDTLANQTLHNNGVLRQYNTDLQRVTVPKLHSRSAVLPTIESWPLFLTIIIRFFWRKKKEGVTSHNAVADSSRETFRLYNYINDF